MQEILNPKIDQFIAAVARGLDEWVEASVILVDIVNEQGEESLALICKKCPGLSMTTLEIFLAIGRKEIYPGLAWDQTVGASKLAALPYQEQKRFYGSGVPLVQKGPAGGFICSAVAVGSLTAGQCHQVFDGCRVREEMEQRTWMMRKERERGSNSIPGAQERATRGYIAPKEREPDAEPQKRMSLDEMLAAKPVELLKDSADRAHAALMDARRHMDSVKKGSKKADLITAALKAVGELRYAINNGEL